MGEISMIDIHCHLLPGIDDGPSDWNESMRMARIAANNGIRSIIATPHHGNGRYSNDPECIEIKVRECNAMLVERGIPIHVYPGQEFHLHERYEEDLEHGRIQTLADSHYLLVELPHRTVPPWLSPFLARIRSLGLRAIIAHPERNERVMRHPKLLGEWIEQGVLAQVTTHSLLGNFGKKPQATALHLCERGWVHFVASDAHHSIKRSFFLRESYHALSGIIGVDEVSAMQNNASGLLQDSYIKAGS